MILDDKLMKYVLYQKRTQKEVIEKCKHLGYEEGSIDEIIEYLEGANYINDEAYIEKFIQNAIRVKRNSIFEIKMGLARKGIKENEVEKYINNELYEYEAKCAKELANREYRAGKDIERIKRYLINKGYDHSSMQKAIDNLENMNDN